MTEKDLLACRSAGRPHVVAHPGRRGDSGEGRLWSQQSRRDSSISSASHRNRHLCLQFATTHPRQYHSIRTVAVPLNSQLRRGGVAGFSTVASVDQSDGGRDGGREIPADLRPKFPHRQELASSVRKDEDEDEAKENKVTKTEDRASLIPLLSLAYPQRNRLAVGLALTLASASVNLLIPFTVGKILDVASSSPTMSPSAATALDVVGGPVGAVTGLGALFFLQAGAMVIRAQMLNSAGERISCDLRERVFGNLLRQEVSFFATNFRRHKDKRGGLVDDHGRQGDLNAAGTSSSSSSMQEKARDSDPRREMVGDSNERTSEGGRRKHATGGQKMGGSNFLSMNGIDDRNSSRDQGKNEEEAGDGKFRSHGTGDLITRLTSDTVLLQRVLTTQFVQATRSSATLLGSIGMMATISPTLSLLSFSVFPPLFLAAAYFGRRMRKEQERVQSALGRAGASAQRSLLQISTLRSLVRPFFFFPFLPFRLFIYLIVLLRERERVHVV